MEKWEIRPPLPQKPLNRSSPKFALVITSGTPTPTQNFTIPSPAFPRICENVPQVTRLFFGSFFGLQPRPLHTPIFTTRMPNGVIFHACAFSGPENKILHFDLIFLQDANFWPIFDGTWKISRQKGINSGDARD